jgi:hypothetical protein
MRAVRYFFLVGIIPAVMLSFGCTKTFVIQDPSPSSVKYYQAHGTPVKLSLEDHRAQADRALSSGTLPVRLKNMENELDFMGRRIEKEFNSNS